MNPVYGRGGKKSISGDQGFEKLISEA